MLSHQTKTVVSGAATRPTEPDFLPWTPYLVRVLAGLMLSMFVAAMDSTVVGTALPTIARELGGFALYPWVFTGYLLTSTTTVPLWGRLADLRGRRTMLLVGLAVFVGSSALCGIAPGMVALIVFRTLQGVGAGCLQPVTLTIVGDLFPLRQRARLQGFFSGMWALAAVIGPLLGALFVSTIGWRWIFFINLPIGVASAWLLLGYEEQRRPAGGARLDFFGAAVLTAAIGLLLWGLGTGSSRAEPIWWAAGAGAALLVLAGWWESKPERGVLPADLFVHGVIGPAVLASSLAGVVMFGITAYVPLFVQGALGGSAFMAGAAVAPMSFGWPIGSVASGRLLVRTGYRPLIVAGGVGMVVGGVVLVFGAHTTVMVGIASAFAGLGLGLLSTPVLIVVQSSVEWGRRGGATALVQFSRTIGGAIGVSLMGVLLQARLGATAGADPLRGASASAQAALAGAIEAVFWVVLALAAAVLLTTLAILLRPRPVALAG